MDALQKYEEAVKALREAYNTTVVTTESELNGKLKDVALEALLKAIDTEFKAKQKLNILLS